MVNFGSTSPTAKPQPLITRYRCGFPGCNKRYASTDGVRKHARKTHLDWLKSVDLSAGSRDRHLESKPSTYCHKEEGYADDEGFDITDDSSPTLTPICGGISGMAMGGGSLEVPPLMSLPEAATNPLGAAAASSAMAAAAAGLLAQQAQSPLAWLLTQHALANGCAALPSSNSLPLPPPPAPPPAPPIGLPVSMGQPPLPPWMAALHDPAFPLPAPSSMPSPTLNCELPTANSLGSLSSVDLSALFGPTCVDDAAREQTSGGGVDPLCLTPPTASVIGSACVSPFELDKKPKAFDKEGMLVSPSREALGGCAAVSAATEDDFELNADYAAFVETLLA